MWLGPHADLFQILGLFWVCSKVKKFTSVAANNTKETYSAFMVSFVNAYFTLTNHSTLF